MRPLLIVAALTAAAACTRSPAPDASRLDPRLRQIAAERPDTTIGVLVRTEAPVDEDQRSALEGRGLRVGTVAGEIVTGRIRAGAASGLAALPFVLYVEAAASIPVPRPPDTTPASAQPPPTIGSSNRASYEPANEHLGPGW